MNRLLSWICLAALLCLFDAPASAQKQPLFSLPFQLVDNRPYIEVTIHQHTFHFILDCGAPNVLDISTARKLKLKLTETGMQNGVGAKKANSWITAIDTVQVGPMHIIQGKYNVADFTEIREKLHLPWLDGVIGYTFMKDYAVQFNYPKNVVSFFGSYTAADPVSFKLYSGQIPQIKVTIDGNNAEVIVDTGDRTAFTIFNHYARQNHLYVKYSPGPVSITGYGIGGAVYAHTFTLAKLGINNTVFTSVPTRIPVMKTGLFAVSDIDGSIGGGILKRYKFTIDYTSNRLYFEKP